MLPPEGARFADSRAVRITVELERDDTALIRWRDFRTRIEALCIFLTLAAQTVSGNNRATEGVASGNLFLLMKAYCDAPGAAFASFSNVAAE